MFQGLLVLVLECFTEKKLEKTNQTESKAEKVIKRKGDKLFVKRKC